MPTRPTSYTHKTRSMEDASSLFYFLFLIDISGTNEDQVLIAFTMMRLSGDIRDENWGDDARSSLIASEIDVRPHCLDVGAKDGLCSIYTYTCSSIWTRARSSPSGQILLGHGCEAAPTQIRQQ